MDLAVQEDRIISLYEITKILGKEHNKAIKLVDELIATEGFGTVEKKATVYNEHGQTIQTYFFTKRQALIVGGRLDNKNLIKIVDKLEELSVRSSVQLQQYQQPQIDSQELAQTVASAVVQAMVQVIPMMNQNNQETELDKQKKRLEIEELQLKKISMVADLATKYKLEQLGDLSSIPSELSDSMKSLAGAVVKEVRPAINGVSPTSALNAFGEAVRVKDFYKAMNDSGLTSYHEETRYLGGVNITHEIINEGRYYGYNQHASSIKKYPVQCKFYSDRFPELLVLLRRNGFLV